MRRSVAVAVAVAAALLGVVAERADAALFVVFEPAEAEAGDVVTLRLGGTPADFTPADAEPPAGEPVRVFLVPNYAAADVRAADDERLTYVATIEPDASGHGVATFTVPDLAPGLYAAAFDCPACADNSGGRTFSVVDAVEDVAPEYRGRVGLTIERGAISWWWPVIIVAFVAAAAVFAVGRRRRTTAFAA